MPEVTEALEDFAEAKPYLRSAVALAVFLRWGSGHTDDVATSYKAADLFLAQFEKDLGAK
jgi:hypothetical protein